MTELRALTLLLIWVLSSHLHADERDQKLSEYLREHDLNRLELSYLEIKFSRTIDKEQRKHLANLLSERYSHFLFRDSTNVDPASIIARAESLMQDFPERPFSNLELAVYHAKLRIHESQFHQWWNQGASISRSRSIIDSFSQLQSELRRWMEREQQKRDKAMFAAPLAGAAAQPQHHEKLKYLESRLLHAHYLTAWTCLFRAFVPTDLESQDLLDARRHFRAALQFEQDYQVEKIGSRALDLENSTHRKALLGLAMLYSASNEPVAARDCLDKLDGYVDELAIRAAEFNSLAFGRRWQDALKHASRAFKVDWYDSPRYWTAVLNAGDVAMRSHSKPSNKTFGEQLRRMGLLGLLRSFDSNSIQNFAQRTEIKLGNESVEDLWCQSLIAFNRALNEPANSSELQRAADLADKALERIPFAEQDRNYLQFLAASIQFQQKKFSQAIATLPFMDSSSSSVTKKLSEKIGWLRCRCWLELQRHDSRHTGDAMASINQFLSEFPRSIFAERGKYELLLVTSSLLPDSEALKNLRAIQQDHPYFLQSKLEIAKRQFARWKSLSLSTDEAAAFGELESACLQYQALSSQPEQKLLTYWLLLDAHLSRPFSHRQIQSILDEAEKLALLAPNRRSSLESKIHYYRFAFARKSGRTIEAVDWAKKLLGAEGDARTKLAALEFLAQSGTQSLTLQEEIAIYKNLLKRLGSDQATLSQSSNARVAAHRLVELWMQTQAIASASSLNEKLLKSQPNSLPVLLNAARIASSTDQHEKAIEYWKRVVRATDAGTDNWLEGKFGIITSLSVLEPATARKLLTQTLALAGPIRTEWQRKFLALSASLEDRRLKQDKP